MRSGTTSEIIGKVFEGLLQPGHLVLVLTIALILFGPGKLGEIGAQLGRGVREFRESTERTAPGRQDVPSGTGAAACAVCGAATGADATFCTSCGSRLGARGV